ncbi:AMP-binding protein [Microbacterium schleiferi]|uniref:AMP-binding protein n=1 Tax=Microbacterium schleiferi TaxID=69362 RepID=UPI002B4C2475|nr:AMP-binding protein [Microbacterium schleiferi]
MTNRSQDDTPAEATRRLIRLSSACKRDTDALMTALREALAEPPGGDQEPAVIVETSGSSGYPKAVVLPISSLRASAEATAARIGAGSWVLALEQAYVAGLQVLVRSILAGTDPVVIPASFTAAEFVVAAARIDEPRYTSLVPAQLARLLDAADDTAVAECLRGFAAILVGGQALPATEADRAAALGIRIVRTYGSSETSGGCVYDGVPLPGWRCGSWTGRCRSRARSSRADTSTTTREPRRLSSRMPPAPAGTGPATSARSTVSSG